MATFIMQRPTNSAVVTMKFKSYNAAVDFAKRSGMLQPSKPYKRNIYQDGELTQIWCVTMPNMNPSNATFCKVETVNSTADFEKKTDEVIKAIQAKPIKSHNTIKSYSNNRNKPKLELVAA